MVTAKLVGESDGYIVSRTFEEEGSAIGWLKGPGLAEFGDQTARGEVWVVDKLVWTKANLQTAENKERDRLRYTARWRAGAFCMGKDT